MNWTYPLLMSAAVTTGLLVSRLTPRPAGLSARQRLAIGLGAFCGGMLAAKLPFVLLDWEGFLSGAAWFDSGKTLVLGLVGGYFGVEATKWALNIRVRTGDSFAAPVAAAVAVGRLACFSAGCCHGVATSLPWGVDFGDGVCRHPTQLYEAAFHLTCAAILLQMQARGVCRGQLVKLYIIAYLTYRFLTEYVRPEPELWLGWTAYQWGSLVLIPVFALLWWRDARSLRREAPAALLARA
ncbi:MAG: prolipoprotein diacylglyceryl transferase family protein [Gemmataceae bacterium]